MTQQIIEIPTNGTPFEFVNEAGSFAQNTIIYSGPTDGTATAGTITVNCKAPGGIVFESPTDGGVVSNTIDIAAPEKLNIFGQIHEYEVTVTGFTGTANLIKATVSSYV